MAQKPALGKGLASLFPNMKTPQQEAAPTAESSPEKHSEGTGATAAGAATTIEQSDRQGDRQSEMTNKDRHPGISIAGLDEIIANQYQPRRDFDDRALEELAASIRENGIIQPLIVRRASRGYELIAGERRFRAARLAGLSHVPIVIRKSTDRESLELALVENIQRSDLNCVDEALAYFQLMEDFNLTQEEVARRVGKDRASVANHLRLLRLPEAVLEDLKQGVLSFGHGKVLCSVEDPELRLRLRGEILRNQMSVREAEALAAEMKKAQSEAASGQKEATAERAESSTLRSRMATLAQDLTRLWSTKVELKGSEKKGKLVVHYGSRDELERILSAMQNKDLWRAQ